MGRLAGVLSILVLCSLHAHSLDACCAVFPLNHPVVNADQSVIILWDAANKTQHFIRQASFKSDADDFGFLVPSPTQPELAESGNDAFPYLVKVTEPETKTRLGPPNFGCSVAATRSAPGDALWSVKVLEEKRVAGFDASVLEAKSATALVQWLKANGYHFSLEVGAWAKPYVDAGWKITALKVAKDKENGGKTVAASALRMSFKTDRPLFPYREPDSTATAKALGVKHRLLRIYFLAEARYQGDLPMGAPAWTGKVVWSGKLKPAQRTKLLEHLNLPQGTGPADWWLTEFEDDWTYRNAPADVYFARDRNQGTVRRPPHIQYVESRYPKDAVLFAFVGLAFVPSLIARLKARRAAGI